MNGSCYFSYQQSLRPHLPRSVTSSPKDQCCHVPQDGLVLLKGALTLQVQQAIVHLVREVGMGPAGFYAPKTRGGEMHLQMMCLGRHWNRE